MDLDVTTKQYFNTLNALAEKIAADIENTRDAYQDLWNAMSKSEQNQAIDESLINPTAVLKYANLSTQAMRQNFHPFSWFTKSQLNLCTQIDHMGYSDPKNVLSRSDTDQIPQISKPKDVKMEVDGPSKMTKIEEKSKSSSHKGVQKPKGPPPPPPAKVAQVEEVSKKHISNNDIPKTGFDFLDNW